jgi:hypothetical protein
MGRPRMRWKNNITMDLRDVDRFRGWKVETNWLRICLVTGFSISSVDYYNSVTSVLVTLLNNTRNCDACILFTQSW